MFNEATKQVCEERDQLRAKLAEQEQEFGSRQKTLTQH
jgi:hypothetical protein